AGAKLVSRVRDSLTKSRHAGEDLVCGFVPHKRSGGLVADRQVLPNRGLEGAGAAMRTALDLLLGQRGEPAFHQVEPRRTGGREVHMKSGMPSEPPPNLRGFMRAVVVQNQMDVEVGRHRVVNRVEKAQELSTAMSAMTFPNDAPGRNVQRGKQRRGAVPDVIMGPPLRLPRTHRQQRRGAIE